MQSHRSLASGFFWREDLVVTANETLAENGSIQVERHDGTVLEAALAGRDPATDIALLRVDNPGGAPAEFDLGRVRPGELALIVAAADSVPLTAFGTIAVAGPAWQSMRGGIIATRLEIDLRLRQRVQGGLALTGKGHAIGMAVPAAQLMSVRFVSRMPLVSPCDEKWRTWHSFSAAAAIAPLHQFFRESDANSVVTSRILRISLADAHPGGGRRNPLD